MTILYIDDDIEDIEIFAEAINAVDSSIKFNSARSGREALTMLHESDSLPTHIVLDVNMPGMDGKSCLREIRGEKKFADIKVFVYSTNSFPGDIQEMESLGRDIEAVVLARAVRMHLEGASERGNELRHRLEEVGLKPIVGDGEDRRFRIFVYRDDDLGVLHSGKVLDRTADAAGDV